MSDIFKPASPENIANRQPYIIDAPIYPLKTLQELSEVISGVEVPSDKAGIWHLIRERNIVKGTISSGDIFVPVDFVKKHPEGVIVPGDIIVPPYLGKYEVCVVPSNLGPSFIGSGIVRIRPFKYLRAFLRTEFGKSIFLEQLLNLPRGGAIKSVLVKDIKELTIPILSPDILKVFEADISQNSTLKELQNTYSICEKETLNAIISMLVQRGWSEGDIDPKVRISESLSTDILLRRKGKPVALVEIKKDTTNIEPAIQQIRLMCKEANIRFGYLISETGIMEVNCSEDKTINRQRFPSPVGLK